MFKTGTFRKYLLQKLLKTKKIHICSIKIQMEKLELYNKSLN
ncbi:MAG: hypothetical protein JWN78_2381 [Bacteroidota bacterium]|nr:hypothetical protein [Bacteroidota bacterium]